MASDKILSKQAEAQCKALSGGRAKSAAKPNQAPASQTQSSELLLPTKPLSRPYRGYAAGGLGKTVSKMGNSQT